MVAYWLAGARALIIRVCGFFGRCALGASARMSRALSNLSFDASAALGQLEFFHGDQISGMPSLAQFPYLLSRRVTPAGTNDETTASCDEAQQDASARNARPIVGARIARWQDENGQAARTPLTYEASVVVALAITGVLALRMAETPARGESRNAAAESIAAQFAAASDGAAAIEERFAFARRFRVIAAPIRWFAGNGVGARSTDASSREPETGSSLPFSALGAVVIHGLPDGTRLSQGRGAGGTWIVAPGDLDGMEVVVPAGGITKLARARIEVLDQSGVRRGALAFGLREEEGPGIALGALRGKDGLDWIGAGAGRRLAAPDRGIRTGALNAPAEGEGLEPDVPRKVKSAAGHAGAKRVHRRLHHATAPARTRRAKGTGAAVPSPSVPARPAGGADLTVQPKPPLLAQPEGDQDKSAGILLFKPANTQQGQALLPVAPLTSLIQLGVFPRSPMEEEAARK